MSTFLSQPLCGPNASVQDYYPVHPGYRELWFPFGSRPVEGNVLRRKNAGYRYWAEGNQPLSSLGFTPSFSETLRSPNWPFSKAGDLVGNTSFEFRILGPIEVADARGRIELGGAKPRKLLSALVANRNQTVSIGQLIDILWGDNPPATARKSLQKFVWALRKDLVDLLVTRDQGYLVMIDDVQLDAGRLDRAVGQARRGEPGWEVALTSALAEWRGEPYPDLTDTELGLSESTRLVDLRLEGEELLIGQLIESQEYQSAVSRAEGIISRHPYREGLWANLMLGLYGSGRQADALAAYRRLRKTLGDELGIDPSPELARLEERILLQDPVLAPPEARPTPHNLPAPMTSFVGREVDIAAVRDLLGGGRLVTLLGTAGSGKTRLAIEVGRLLLDDFSPDGIWFVDLARLTSPDQVLGAIGGALGVGQLADTPLEDVVASFLSQHRVMLIVDNCEHLIRRVAEVVGHLLRSAPELVVLATSRERIGIDGESVFDVGPLRYPKDSDSSDEDYDAVRLFIERARATSQGDNLRSEDPTVAEIVRRLDGIPLALELAAARVRGLGLEGLRDHLDDRFSILTSPSRAAIERHQTLEAALGWSYRLLENHEQVLFARLSVFRGGFELDSVSVVCTADPLDAGDVAGLMSELVDKSLVSLADTTGRRRYYLLESLREYGRAQLDQVDGSRLRAAHVSFFCELAETAAEHLRGPDQVEWLATLRREYDNLRKAIRWAFETTPVDGVRLAIALAGYWDSVGPRTEGNHWLKRAVEISADLDPLLHIDALLEAASIASSVRASIPIEYARQAEDAARGIGDEIREARALRATCWALAVDEKPEEALEAGRKALEIFEQHDHPWDLALCLERLGQASYRDPETSISQLERALAIYRELGDRSRQALALYKIADRLAHSVGDLGRARAFAEQAIAISDDVGNTHDGAHARLEYGKILRRQANYERAISVLREALGQTKRSGDERCTVRTLTVLGSALIESGRSDEGVSKLTDSLVRGRALGEIHTTRSAIAGLARFYAGADRPRDAVMLLAFVEELTKTLDVPVSDRASDRRRSERAQLRDDMGDEFEDAWERGRLMTIEQAVELALSGQSSDDLT